MLGELEVHGPHGGGCWTQSRLTEPAAGGAHFRFLGVGRCKPSFRQGRCTRLLVQRPALASEQPVGHPTAPAHVVSGDLAETMPQLGLLQVDNLNEMALGAALRTHHPSG